MSDVTNGVVWLLTMVLGWAGEPAASPLENGATITPAGKD